MAEVIQEFKQLREELKKADVGYFEECLRGIEKEQEELEANFTSFLDRPLNELGHIERSILVFGSYELQHRPEIPYRVIINEAIELAKMFAADDSHKYVNGILDKTGQKLRSIEIQANKASPS